MKKENKIDINRRPGKTTFVKNQMAKEFNLSEKICLGSIEHTTFLIPEDVKEFIKKLKMRLYELKRDERRCLNLLYREIDKLAGEKLI